MTSGRTVTLLGTDHRRVAAAPAAVPQVLPESITYAAIATVMLASILSINVLAGALHTFDASHRRGGSVPVRLPAR